MNKNQKRLIGIRNAKREGGFALLEYCAGEAVILVVIWGAMQALGDNISTLLGAVGSWATSRATEIQGVK